MNEHVSAAPGWYSNSVPGQQQWWDGAAWTQNTRATPGGSEFPGIGFNGSPETLEARKTYWTGWSRDASLILGIVLAVLSFPAALGAVFGVLSFSIIGIPLVLIWLLFAGGAVAMFVNYYVRGKQLAVVRARQAPPVVQAPTEQQSPG
jgi:hypothetical protein